MLSPLPELAATPIGRMASTDVKELQRIAKKLCAKETCAIQSCLQEHNYQQAACEDKIEELKKCCRKLSPQVLNYSIYCEGFIKPDSLKTDNK